MAPALEDALFMGGVLAVCLLLIEFPRDLMVLPYMWGTKIDKWELPPKSKRFFRVLAITLAVLVYVWMIALDYFQAVHR